MANLLSKMFDFMVVNRMEVNDANKKRYSV